VTTFVLVPGAGGDASYWHRLVPELERLGHRALAVDLPAADPEAGLAADADTVVGTVPTTSGEQPAAVVLVARSMGGHQARTPGDRTEAFFHDVPADVAAVAQAEPFEPSGRLLEDPWPLDRWSDVPTRVLAGRDDRFFPLEVQRRVAAERPGLPVDEVPGGHLVALSRPVERAERLVAYLTG
jgi:pimeloyl-ACP methyl ester carboxylesterase